MQSSSSNSTGIATVSQERKQELLIEARKARITWIQSSSFPFIEDVTKSKNEAATDDLAGKGINTNGGGGGDDDEEETMGDEDDGMQVIHNVCHEVKLPSAIPIINLLIEKTNHAQQPNEPQCNTATESSTTTTTTTTTTTKLTPHKLSNQLKTKLLQNQLDNANNKNNNNHPSSQQEKSLEISMESLMKKTDDHLFLFYYKDVLDKLCLPECADIVQGMRHFERSFHDLSLQLQQKLQEEPLQQPQKQQGKVDSTRRGGDHHSNDQNGNENKNKSRITTSTTKQSNNANQHITTLAKGIQKYLAKLYESLSSHIAWRDNVISSESKMMLETLIYSKCHLYIQPILAMVTVENNDDVDNDDDDDDDCEENDSQEVKRYSKKSGHDKQRELKRICDDEANMQRRLKFLQFVQPKHLDMHAFTPKKQNVEKDDEGKGENDDSIDNVNDEDGDKEEIPWQSKLDLSKPIAHVKSLDSMYSPTQMLRCILEIYRCVNDALNESLKMANANASNKDKSSSENENWGGNNTMSSSSSSPNVSADDVLPSLILSVIHAKPSRIITNLIFLEKFATDEQIRGEAGYAFTNLFSAVQFIKELDLQVNDDDYDDESNNIQEGGRRKIGQPTLSMSVEVLHEKMKKFRQDCKSRKEANETSKIEEKEESVQKNSALSESKECVEPDDHNNNNVDKFTPIQIPTHVVKAARLRGESIDKWATKWFGEQIQNGSKNDSSDKEEKNTQNQKLNMLDIDGFSRSYSFLATDAKDVKVSDIPELLREYKMLVRTTETLLMERNSFIQQNKQKKVASKRGKLQSSLDAVMNK